MSKVQTNYDELLKAISDIGDDAETLAKAIPADVPEKPGKPGAAPDDKAIAAAAADGVDPDEEINGDQTMSKSLTVTDAAGNPVEAIDATDLIKSLQDKVGAQDTVLAKAIGGIGTILKKQNDLIKSLQDNMAKLGNQGTGRKAVFVAVDKPGVGGDLAKSGAADEGTLNPDEFFAKAETAFASKKITGQELNTISVCMRMNAPLDPALIRKVALSQ